MCPAGEGSLAGKSTGFRAVPQPKCEPGRVRQDDAYRCRVPQEDFGLEANKAMAASNVPVRNRPYALFLVGDTHSQRSG